MLLMHGVYILHKILIFEFQHLSSSRLASFQVNGIIVIPNGYTKGKSECICNFSLQQVFALHHDLYLKENSDLLLVDSNLPIDFF